MTSKEAIKDIKEWVEYFANWGNLKHFEKNEFEEAISVLEKDLEVLEIIKNHIVTKNFEYGSDFDSYNKISFAVEIMQLKDFTDKSNGLHYTTFKVDNGFEKVKEWLENDN